MAVTLSLDDYFVATYTKPATFDTISTYVVNATKGSQTDIKTALWALSTIIFLIVIVVEIALILHQQEKLYERRLELMNKIIGKINVLILSVLMIVIGTAEVTGVFNTNRLTAVAKETIQSYSVCATGKNILIPETGVMMI